MKIRFYAIKRLSRERHAGPFESWIECNTWIKLQQNPESIKMRVISEFDAELEDARKILDLIETISHNDKD